MNNCLILTEAGKGIGYGHLNRCSAIFEALKAIGGKHKMIVEAKENIDIESYNAESCSWLKQGELQHIGDFDVVLIDSYLADLEIYHYINKRHPVSVAIDDYQRLPYPQAWILNPNVYGHPGNYPLQPGQRLIGGRDYVILREAFRLCNRKSETQEQLKKILITVGGSDYRQLIPKLLKLLPDTYDITVVSAQESYRLELEDAFSSRPVKIHGFVSAENMRDLMLACDLCLSANGQSLHELAYLGVPTIGICIDQDQEQNTDFYVDANYLPGHLRWDDKHLEDKLMDTIEQYQCPDHRQQKSLVGQSLVNGDGVKRIADMLLKVQPE